jgi:hypothetical protein
MERGIDFLKSQVNNAVMQHGSFLESLRDHADQADDQRFRDLCSRHVPMMEQHQRMLEDYQRELGADGGGVKEALGKMMGKAKDLADSVRENDFLRLVGDIVMARQSEDTFKTFREAGKTLGNARLQQIGDVGERHHDEYVKEANRLAQSMFVENVRAGETGATTRSSADYSRERRPEL